jgi:hypothetical protein
MNRTAHGATKRLLSIAQFGLAHSFFGQLYEAVVDIPRRIAQDPEPNLSSAGPTRYFPPTAPVTRCALLVAAATGWREPRTRPWLTAALVGAGCEAVLTVYLVRNVNARAFVAGQPLAPAERETLVRTWHQLNRIRLAAAPISWAAVTGARNRLS